MTQRLRLAQITPGMAYTTPGVMITESHIVGFAGMSGDFFDVHMDDNFAREVGFPGRVAHGLLCLSMIDGLKNRSTTLFDAIASLEWHYRFKKPVLIGDRIEGRIRVLETRATRAPSRGIVRIKVDAYNQHGELVQDGENVLLVKA